MSTDAKHFIYEAAVLGPSVGFDLSHGGMLFVDWMYVAQSGDVKWQHCAVPGCQNSTQTCMVVATTSGSGVLDWHPSMCSRHRANLDWVKAIALGGVVRYQLDSFQGLAFRSEGDATSESDDESENADDEVPVEERRHD